MDKDSKIYVAGHRGLVGSAIIRKLETEGYTNLITAGHRDLDLCRQADVEAFFNAHRPEYVFLAAARVGGIGANSTCPAEFIYENLAIQTNVIHAAWKNTARRLLFLGSSCIYPRDCPQPMKEAHLMSGPLETTNEAYALAKIAGIQMCKSYNRQYGTRFLGVMPTNLYGPNDNFDLETSHVFPALIRKFHLAKLAAAGDWQSIRQDASRFGRIPDGFLSALAAISLQGGHTDIPCPAAAEGTAPAVILWGTGSPRREFLHVDDMADACLFLLGLDDKRFDPMLASALVNIGCGKDAAVRDLADTVRRVVGFSGATVYDASKPDGTPQKLLDVSKMTALGWQPAVSLMQGIDMTYRWYLDKK